MVDDSRSHTLDAGQSETNTFTISRDSIGDYIAIIKSNDDQAEKKIEFLAEEDAPGEIEGNLYGYIRGQYGDQVIDIPVYDPESIPHPCWRFQVDETNTGAFYLEDRDAADFRSFSIETAGGPKGISKTERFLNDDVIIDASAPETLEPHKDYFTVQVTIVNERLDTVSGTLSLQMGGVTLHEQNYTVDGGSSKNYTIEVGPVQSGTYNWLVNTDHGSDSGTVEAKSDRHLIDDFSHNNLSQFYEDNTDHYYVTSKWAYQGDYAIQNDPNYVGAIINSHSGLDTYPQQGDRIDFIFRTNFDETTTDRALPSLRFGHTDNQAFYETRIRIDTQRMVIQEKHPDYTGPGWNSIRIKDIDLNFPAHTNVRFSTFWGQDNIGMRLYNDETEEPITPYISGSPEYHQATSGGVGLSLESYGSTHQLLADYLHVNQL